MKRLVRLLVLLMPAAAAAAGEGAASAEVCDVHSRAAVGGGLGRLDSSVRVRSEGAGVLGGPTGDWYRPAPATLMRLRFALVRPWVFAPN